MQRELPPPLRPLLRRLKASRARFQFQRGLELGGWVLLMALGFWVGLQLWNYLPTSELSPRIAFWICLGYLALGWVVVVVYLWYTAPTLQKVAQLAEQQLELKERLSTVLEVVGAEVNPLQSRMHQALIEDTAQYLPQVQPARVVPFKLPKSSRYLLGVVGLALLIQFLPPSGDATPVQAIATTEQPQIVVALERLIREVQQDAERTNDAYLRAEARNLEQLRNQVQQGKISGDVLGRELNASLGRLGQSYGLSPNSQGAQTVGQSSGGSGATPPKSSPSAQGGTANYTKAAQRSLEQFTQRLQARRNGGSSPNSRTPNPDELSKECIYIEGYECLTSAQVAKLQKELASSGPKIQIQAPEGGTPGGSGDKAGKGVQAKLGARQNLEKKPATQQLMLPKHAPKSSQRHIQISAPTQLAPALQAAGGVAGAWRFGEELPVETGLQALGPEGRAAVGRYFARDDDPKEE